MRSRLPFDVWLSLAGPIAVLLVFAAGSGLFVRGLCRDAPFVAVHARHHACYPFRTSGYAGSL